MFRRMKFERSFFIGKGYEKLTDWPAEFAPLFEAGAEVWVKPFDDKSNRVSGTMFLAKQQKPVWQFYFKSDERLKAKVIETLKGALMSFEYRAKRAAERKSFVPSLKVGAILYTSWGYDQTNVEFFQVTAVPSAKTVEIRKIAGQNVNGREGMMSGYYKPVPNSFIGEPMVKRVIEGNAVKISKGSYRNAHETDPSKEHYVSWYA